MTSNEFRRMALSFDETEERSHMNHPDFRARGKIFASLHFPDKTWGMVKLFPDQQEEFVDAAPEGFVPANGAWGRWGCTLVNLKIVKKSQVKKAMTLAWANATAAKKMRARPK